MSARLLLALSLAPALACRPDPGVSHYEQQEPFSHDMAMAGPLPGPDPYRMGEKRLSVGAFYEGGYSDIIAIDNQSTHLYIYHPDGTMMNTVALTPDADHIEGTSSTLVTHAGLSWWGFGVHWDKPGKSMSGWTQMHVSLKSSSTTFATMQIGMNNDNPVFVDAAKYGYAADGAWHDLVIPIADFVSGKLDLTKVQAAFVLVGGAGALGDQLRVDDLYFSAD